VKCGNTSAFWGRTGRLLKQTKVSTPMCCKLCMKKIKYCGNTSNLRSHLELEHKKEFQVLLSVDAEKSKKKVRTMLLISS